MTFLTPCALKFDLIKNDLNIFFCRTCSGLSNAVYRLSLSFLVFEFSGGGAGIHPPAVRRWLRPPAVRGLTCNLSPPHCIKSIAGKAENVSNVTKTKFSRRAPVNFHKTTFLESSVVGEGHLFATLPDLRPPPLQGNWWGTKVQITCQKVGHIRFVRSNPFPSSPVSGGLNQVMEQEKCNFLT